MSWRIFDRAKGVAIAAGAASLFAIAGVFALAGSMAAMLAMAMPWPAALAITAVAFLAVAAIAMWVGIQPSHPDKSDDKDAEQASAAALAVLDLPVEAARRVISERPIAAVVLVSSLGLLIARRPQIALKVVDKILERFT